MLKLVLKVIGFVIAAIIGLAILGILLKLLGLLAALAIGLAMLAGFVYVILLLLGVDLKARPPAVKTEYRVFDVSKSNISLFLNKPTVQDIVSGQTTEAVLSGAILEIDNDTNVIVLDDSDKEAVRVKVTGGKWGGKSGWVCRSALIKSERLLSG